METTPEKVHIQDPPIKEFSKKKSCFFRGCSSGCGCLVLLIIGSLIGLRLLSAPQEKKLQEFPNFVVEEIPLYAPDHVTKISFISGIEKSQDLEKLAYIPKILTAPFALIFDIQGNDISTWQDKLTDYISAPVTNPKDTVEATWISLQAPVSLIEEFYIEELHKKGFTVSNIFKSGLTKKLSFEKNHGTIKGELLIEDRRETSQTERVTLKFQVPSE